MSIHGKFAQAGISIVVATLAIGLLTRATYAQEPTYKVQAHLVIYYPKQPPVEARPNLFGSEYKRWIYRQGAPARLNRLDTIFPAAKGVLDLLAAKDPKRVEQGVAALDNRFHYQVVASKEAAGPGNRLIPLFTQSKPIVNPLSDTQDIVRYSFSLTLLVRGESADGFALVEWTRTLSTGDFVATGRTPPHEMAIEVSAIHSIVSPGLHAEGKQGGKEELKKVTPGCFMVLTVNR